MQESNASPEISHIQNSFENKYADDKKYSKNRDHCHYRGKYRGTTHNICNLKNSISKDITALFCNGSNYDYQFCDKGAGKKENLVA